jgi:hypothetical protein
MTQSQASSPDCLGDMAMRSERSLNNKAAIARKSKPTAGRLARRTPLGARHSTKYQRSMPIERPSMAIRVRVPGHPHAELKCNRSPRHRPHPSEGEQPRARPTAKIVLHCFAKFLLAH